MSEFPNLPDFKDRAEYDRQLEEKVTIRGRRYCPQINKTLTIRRPPKKETFNLPFGPDSKNFKLFGGALIQALMDKHGFDEDTAKKVLGTIGLTVLSRLIDGLPTTIPYVGHIFPRKPQQTPERMEHLLDLNMEQIQHFSSLPITPARMIEIRKNYRTALRIREGKDDIFQTKIRIQSPQPIISIVSDNAIPTCSLKEHLHKALTDRARERIANGEKYAKMPKPAFSTYFEKVGLGAAELAEAVMEEDNDQA